jgi:hypothetical protein
MENKRGGLMDNSRIIDNVREMEKKQDPMSGDSGMGLDVNQYPELKGKKEGDTVTITAKVSSVQGTMVYIQPHTEESGKNILPPSKEGYREQPQGNPAENLSQGGM